MVYLRSVHAVHQKDLANYINKSVATISNWEAGKQDPTLTESIKICRFFNVPVVDMLFSDLSNVPVESLIELKASEKSNLNRTDFKSKRIMHLLKELTDTFDLPKEIDNINKGE